MGYHASVYMKDQDGNYTVPVYNEYGRTKLLTAGVIVKLLRGITVDHATIEKGIQVNRDYGREPDKMALEMSVWAAVTGSLHVTVKEHTNSRGVCQHMIFVTENDGTEHMFRIPKDTTTLSAVLFGDWANSVDETGPEVNTALGLVGITQFEKDDVAIRGGF